MFKDLLIKIKGFKYQIEVTVLLSNHKNDGYTEYSPIYFNSTAKTVINYEFSLDKLFQEILYRIDNWISEGFGWITELIEGVYVNISSYSPLIASTYIELPDEVKHPMKSLIKIRNNDNKCFLWCHVRHLNLADKNPQRTTKKIKKQLMNSIMKKLNFLFQKKIILKLKDKIIFVLTCFAMKIN